MIHSNLNIEQQDNKATLTTDTAVPNGTTGNNRELSIPQRPRRVRELLNACAEDAMRRREAKRQLEEQQRHEDDFELKKKDLRS